MIMQTIGLHDRIFIEKTEAKGIRLETDLPGLPTDQGNLACRAAKLLMDEFGIQEGISMYLEKHIPVAAGMAGGSSDAAAVLMGMNELYGLGLSREALMDRAVVLGADVPYCILGGTALAEGIGERLTSLPSIPDCRILLAKPPAEVSTKFVYTHLNMDSITEHPDVDGQIAAIQKGDLQGICNRMGNVLETVTIPACPVIGQIRDRMLEYGAVNAGMSGSGPTVFGIFDSEEKAEEAKDILEKTEEAGQIYLTKACTGGMCSRMK